MIIKSPQTGLPINVHACLLGSSRVRGDVVLPHTPQLSTDASDRVLVFASADSEEAATATRLGIFISAFAHAGQAHISSGARTWCSR